MVCIKVYIRINKERDMNKHNYKIKKNKEWFGVLIIVVGVLFLARTLELPIPNWVYSWPMLIVGIGLMIGFSNKFKDWTWLIVSGFGALFLIDKIAGYDVRMSAIIFPAILIVLGIRLLRKPKAQIVHQFDEASGNFTDLGADESLDDKIVQVAVFGGNKKIMVSKNFKGGEIISVFGGNEINLSKCDIHGKVKIEIVQVFGGTKLIVPANWKIHSEIVSVFGGLDDKRNLIDFDSDDSKILVIEGVSILAGIDIRSY
jgi:predicted membrane protein